MITIIFPTARPPASLSRDSQGVSHRQPLTIMKVEHLHEVFYTYDDFVVADAIVKCSMLCQFKAEFGRNIVVLIN